MKYAPWRMPGGIHPPEHKSESVSSPIRFAGLPSRLIIPMIQHVGEEARPIVSVGDKVLKGQKVGEVRAFVSAPVHATTSGTVIDIGMYPVDHPSELLAQCVVIEPDGRDEWTALAGLDDYRQATASTLQALIREAGIAGMGGAGFPTGAKLSLKPDTVVDTVVINAMECEPYITADDALLREHAAAVLAGGEIVLHMLGAQRLIVGIEDNKPEAILALQQAVQDRPHIEILATPARYPSGAARQTVYILTGREAPADGRTTDVGVFCLNVGTAYAIHRAIEHGEPSISRITTVTGLGVSSPGNFEVRFGTPAEFLLAQAGVHYDRVNRLIVGGPMMGYTLPDLQVPVVKTTNCLIAATPVDFPPPPPEMPCIRCGACEDVCPVNLLPQQLLWFAKSEEWDKAEAHHLDDCIECGACAFACPSHIPLVQYYRFAKGAIAEERREAEKAELARQRFERRKERMAREEAEKEARRKAKAEAAATRVAPVIAEAGATVAVPLPDAKALTIAAALARSNLKKAEKRLAVARDAGEDTSDLLAEIQTLSDAVAAAEAALQQAQTATT
ncbi:MAG TPA: electron transport complex subunit RsxC [Fluviicoccus sp.]|nr:electron transport complex subunit RsxC [Fluviicoccus sp.]